MQSSTVALLAIFNSFFLCGNKSSGFLASLISFGERKGGVLVLCWAGGSLEKLFIFKEDFPFSDLGMTICHCCGWWLKWFHIIPLSLWSVYILVKHTGSMIPGKAHFMFGSSEPHSPVWQEPNIWEPLQGTCSCRWVPGQGEEMSLPFLLFSMLLLAGQEKTLARFGSLLTLIKAQSTSLSENVNTWVGHKVLSLSRQKTGKCPLEPWENPSFLHLLPP